MKKWIIVMKRVVSSIWKVVKKIIYVTISYCLRVTNHQDLSKSQWDALYQFVKFCFVGLLNTAISLFIYYLIIFINSNWYIIGNCCGFVVSVLNSYYWNSNYVFKKKDEKKQTIIKTFLAYGTNLIIGSCLLMLFIEIANISEIVAPLLVLFVTIPLNFFLNKYWVMK